MPALPRRGAPTTLGPNYRKLWTAAAVSTVGDGVHYAALALLAASLTRDPLKVSAVVFASELPVLLFILPGGALVDRWDRRTVLWTVDTFRCIVVAVLAAAVLAGWASIPLLAAAGFLLGAGETLFNTAAQAIVPAIASRDPQRLERANGRLQGAAIVGQQFIGPPTGGFLFSLAASLPFWLNAISFAVSSALLAAIPGRFRHQDQASKTTTTLRTEITEGLRWLLAHRLLRTIAIMVGVTNLLAGAWLAILVLFAKDELHITDAGYGLLLAAFAAGGTLGSLLAARLSHRFGTARILLAEVLLEGITTVALGLTSIGWVAGALLVALGFQVLVWNVVSASLRQSLLPDELIGRVVSAYHFISMGTGPLGALLGGVLGRMLGLRAPFLLTGLILVPMALLALPVVNTRTVQAARVEADARSR
jgi:MFS family permease